LNTGAAVRSLVTAAGVIVVLLIFVPFLFWVPATYASVPCSGISSLCPPGGSILREQSPAHLSPLFYAVVIVPLLFVVAAKLMPHQLPRGLTVARVRNASPREFSVAAAVLAGVATIVYGLSQAVVPELAFYGSGYQLGACPAGNNCVTVPPRIEMSLFDPVFIPLSGVAAVATFLAAAALRVAWKSFNSPAGEQPRPAPPQ
jgi:uncharacterized protein YggT (Ycf19 family)